MSAALLRCLAFAIALTALGMLSAAPARAIPVFAHRYGVTCQTCHNTVPQLNAFGQAFLAGGYTWPAGAKVPAPVFPVTLKVNLAYSSAPDPSGLPKAIVDEIEILTGGSAGKQVSYFVEQYAIDGGRIGRTRDAWLRYDSRLGQNENRWSVQAGQFTLPLPVDPESFRETLTHYAIFDQTGGANPFNFFDPRQGVDLGYATHGFDLHALALNGHDPQSGLPRSGADSMFTAAYNRDAVTLSAYRYGGSRPLGAIPDRFERHGFGAQFTRDRVLLEGVWQLGYDTSADGTGGSLRTSGGFVQGRYAFSSGAALVSRVDATSGATGIGRSLTSALILSPARNMRFTLEDVYARGAHTLNIGVEFAY